MAERGAFLRKEGLYYASITKWRQQFSEKNVKSKSHKFTLQHNQVLRENTAFKKKLAQAEAIIELQKKSLRIAFIARPQSRDESRNNHELLKQVSDEKGCGHCRIVR